MATGKCNGNSTCNSNGTRFSQEDFPKLIAMATHGNNLFPDNILPKLGDHDCLIATCEDLKRRFPCQLQSRRDRQMKKGLHDVRFEIPEKETQITKFVDTSIDMSKTDAHKVDETELDIVGTVESSLTKHGCEGTADKGRCRDDDARCFGGHLPVGDDWTDDGIGIGSIDGLRSEEMCVGKGCAEQIGSEDMSSVGSEPSPLTTQRQRQLPKHKRN